MHLPPQGTGWIEVICGSMFSGKTEELIRRLRRSDYARQIVRIFKPATDQRYHDVDIVSHSEQRITSRVISRPEEILDLTSEAVQVVGVDEGQFFDLELVDVCRQLANRGTRVIVAGLEQDYRCEPFPTMARLLVEAEYVTKSLAICMICGNPAVRNQRTTAQGGQIVVGGTETYEARCRRCFRLHEEGQNLFAEATAEA